MPGDKWSNCAGTSTPCCSRCCSSFWRLLRSMPSRMRSGCTPMFYWSAANLLPDWHGRMALFVGLAQQPKRETPTDQ